MLVSVVMPVYNGEAFLETAIRSVLTQTHRDLELVVVDDGSTDSTPDILARFAAIDPRIRVIRQTHRGVSAARNRALAACQGEWVANLDSDDHMLPNRLERQMTFVEQNPEVRVFACRAYYINGEGRILGKTRLEPFVTPEQLRRYVDRGGIVGVNHSSVMMHRATILQVGGYREEFHSAEDLDLWNRVVERGYLFLLQDEILTEYRIHSRSIVTSRMTTVLMDFEWMKACMFARRAGRAEPSREEFLRSWYLQSWPKRLFRRITHQASIEYRAAAFDFASGRHLRGLTRLLLALIYRPDYVITRAASQLTFDR
jgi:glycosyltransferase involved in cell wall biosynthesis